MKTRKYFTTKQWQRFKKNNYFDMQEILCQKYDVILTDYKTRKQKISSILQKINLKNFQNGIIEFSKVMDSVGDSIDQFTRETDTPKQKGSHYKKAPSEGKNNDSLDLIWGKSNSSVPIWSASDDNYDSQALHEENLEKIWGKGN